MKTLKTREWVAVGAAVIVVGALFFGGTIWQAFFGSGTKSVSSTAPTPVTTDDGNLTTTVMQNVSTVKGLEIYDEQVGTGPVATAGMVATVDYVGYLADGTKFDSSIDQGKPLSFTLGVGDVIKGWDMGVAGMKVGGVRRLVVSPELGYGAQGIGPIPSNATLVFEVQLLGVK